MPPGRSSRNAGSTRASRRSPASPGSAMGTLYRRFATKDALIAALVQDVRRRACSRFAEDAAEQPDGRGLEHYLETSSAYQAEHRGCLPRLWNTDIDRPSIHRLRRQIARCSRTRSAIGRVRGDAHQHRPHDDHVVDPRGDRDDPQRRAGRLAPSPRGRRGRDAAGRAATCPPAPDPAAGRPDHRRGLTTRGLFERPNDNLGG